MKYLLILLLLVGCGTRKVATDKTNLQHDSTIIKQNINSIDSVVTNIMRRFVTESRKTADSVVISDGKTIYYNVVTDTKQTDSTKVDILQENRYEEVATNKVESVVLKEKSKDSERKTYWGIIILVGLLIVIVVRRLRK